MQIEIQPPFMLVKPVDDEGEFYARLDEDAPWELLDGRLVMSPASQRHEDLFRYLLTIFSAFLDERGGGVVRGSRYPMRLDPQWSPEPDLLVVLDAHRERLTERCLEGPADMVLEVASEGDPRLDEREKLPRYQQAGIPEIWLVHPRRELLRVDRHLSDGGYETTEVHTGRAESGVVQGLWIDASWLWQDPLPSTMDSLRQILDS